MINEHVYKLLGTVRAFVACCVLMMLPMALHAQQGTGVTIDAKNVSVQDAIALLNRNSNYSVIMNSSDVDLSKTITVKATNATVEEVLSQIFSGQDVSWDVVGTTVKVTKKAPLQQPQPSRTIIKGTVYDEEGYPVIAAAVTVNGNIAKATSTDINGYFELAVSEYPVHLVASSLGYDDASLDLKSAPSGQVKIVMKESVNMLEELVVVGYGTQKRSNLSGAVATINSKELNARPVVSAANALQGADPSLSITFGTGSPESSNTVHVRGSISLNSNSPLILADGIEVNLKQINPNDIESVSVLKDASACAVYGAKASAGVILITTKLGKTGKVSINYNGRMGWAGNTTSTDFISTGYDHVTIVNQFMNDSSDGTMNIFRYTEENGGLQKLYERRNDKVENPERPWTEVGDDGKYYYYGNFDWYGYLYNRIRPQYEHNLSVSGGTDKIKYYASGRYYNQNGIFNVVQDVYTDYSFRAKLQAKLTKWLKYSTNIGYDSSTYTYGGIASYENTITSNQSNICAAFLPLNPDGTVVQYVNQLGKNSPLGAGRTQALTAHAGENAKTNDFMTLLNQLDLNLGKHFSAVFAYDYRTRNGVSKYRGNTFDYSRVQGVIETFNSGTVYNYLREVHPSYKGHNINTYANYENDWKGHYLKVTAGMQYQTWRYSSLDVQQNDLTNDNLASFTVATGLMTIDQTINAYKTLGAFWRVNYDFKGRYIAEISGRVDGSSRFAPESRWGTFPSGSVAWTISEEPFFVPLKNTVDNLKLRLSVGSLGNQQVSDYYAYMDTIESGNELKYTLNYNELLKYSSVSDPKSSGLTWETVTTYNAGLDFGMFGNKLNATFDYYVRYTTDMLTTSLTLPDVYGASTPKANCADLRTNGWEFAINWSDSFKLAGHDFTYNVGASVGDAIRTITKYHNPERLISSYYPGCRVGDIWGYHVEGLFKTDREAEEYMSRIDDKLVNSRVYQCKGPSGAILRAGDVKFADLNGDNKITKGNNTVDNPGDQIIIGNTSPRFPYSFKGGFSWCGVDFSVFFQGIGHRDWYPPAGQAAYDFWGPYAFPPTSFIHTSFMDNVWSEDNTNAYFPRPRGYNAYSSGSLGTNNDRYLQNLAYLRLKNLTLGYTVPDNLTRLAGINRVRIYVSGENLAYWSPLKKYCKTIDPELAGSTSTQNKNSGTGYAYPRTVSVGLDLTF